MSRGNWCSWWAIVAFVLGWGSLPLQAAPGEGGLGPSETRALAPFRTTFSKIEEIWRTAGREGDAAAFEKARLSQEKSPNLAPGIDVYVEMARRTRRLDEALAFYQGRSQVPGEGPMPFYALGRIYLLRQEYPQALSNAQIALEKGCVYWGCAPLMAEAERRVGQWEEAVQWLKQRVAKGRAETRGTSWLSLAEFYLWDPEDDPTAAREALTTALSLLSFGRGLERGLWVEGEFALREGRVEDAERALTRSAAAFDAMGDQASLAEVNLLLIQVYRRSMRPSQALALLERQFEWRQNTGQASAARLTQLEQARTLAEEGRPISAETGFRGSIERCLQEDLPLVLVGVADLARLWQAQGVPGEQILSRLDSVLGSPPPATLVPGLALLQASVAVDNGLAVEGLEAAGRAETSATHDAARALALTFKVRALLLQGEIPQALRTYDQALALMVKTGGTAADLHVDHPEILLTSGEPRAALRVLQQAAKDELEGGDPALILIQLARAYVALGTPERARTLVEEAITSALETGRPSLAATWLGELGPKLASPEQLQLLRQVLTETGDPLARAQVVTLLAHQHLEQGHLDEAYTLLQEAQTLVGLDPGAWPTTDDASLRRQLLALSVPFQTLRWSTAIDLSLAEVSLMGGHVPPHRMTLPWAHLLTRDPLPQLVGASAADLLRVQEVVQEKWGQPTPPSLGDTAETLHFLTSLEPPPPSSPRDLATLQRAGRIFALLARALGTPDPVVRGELASAASLALGRGLVPEVSAQGLRDLASNTWQMLVSPVVSSPPRNSDLLTRLRVDLRPEERVVVMLPGDHLGFAWVISHQEVTLIPLGGVAPLRDQVEGLAQVLADPDKMGLELAEFAWPLAEVLLAPLLPHLPAGAPLKLVTPPDWRALPWEVLPLQSPDRGLSWFGAYAPLTFIGHVEQVAPPAMVPRSVEGPWLLVGDPAYLEDRCGISPSIRAAPPTDSRVVLLGDHPDRLCRAPAELEGMLATRPRRSRSLDVVLAGTSATEEQVRLQLNPSVTVVHFATRAQAWTTPSTRTTVQLGLNLFEETANTPEGDGYLDATEWLTLGLHPHLVMVTGAEVAPGGDSFGSWPLAEMFLRGGTSQVILSNGWVGDPRLSQQVGEFYTLLPGEGAAQALYQSRNHLLSSADPPPPAVWATLRLYEAR